MRQVRVTPATNAEAEQAVTDPLTPTTPLVRLYERPGLPAWRLSRLLAATYGGDLGFQPPRTYANFVASLDGVVALGPEYPSSGSTISGRDPADRFVMGLLRACADAVLIGAGTLRATPGHLWTPAHVCPAAADAYAELRRSRERTLEPLLAVATASGDLPTGHRALREGALILTTTAGARHLHRRVPSTCTVVDLGGHGLLPTAEMLAVIRSHAGEIVLSEAGPRLFGQLAADGQLDELFLTVSPVLAGRAQTDRPGLVAARELLPEHADPATLLSVRAHGSHLFLRYAMRETPQASRRLDERR